MDTSHKCPICGETTANYYGHYRKDGLCFKHSIELKNGKISQCATCGGWHNADEECACKKENVNVGNKNIESETSEESTLNRVVNFEVFGPMRCICCGRKVSGFLFCPLCYTKYKNKELLFKISNCVNVELLDESYEGRFVCKDGHVVKSKSERYIDDYLYDHGIMHAYEKELPFGASKNELLHPDFYLPNYLGAGKDVYLEHWGYNENNIFYTKTKKYKMPIYKQLGITLICTYEKSDSSNMEAALDRKLNKRFLVENTVNFENE